MKWQTRSELSRETSLPMPALRVRGARRSRDRPSRSSSRPCLPRSTRQVPRRQEALPRSNALPLRRSFQPQFRTVPTTTALVPCHHRGLATLKSATLSSYIARTPSHAILRETYRAASKNVGKQSPIAQLARESQGFLPQPIWLRPNAFHEHVDWRLARVRESAPDRRRPAGRAIRPPAPARGRFSSRPGCYTTSRGYIAGAPQWPPATTRRPSVPARTTACLRSKA